MKPDEKRKLLYVRNVGHEPRNLPEDHPDRWMWDYVGRSQDDQDHLRELLDPDPLPAQEESLF